MEQTRLLGELLSRTLLARGFHASSALTVLLLPLTRQATLDVSALAELVDTIDAEELRRMHLVVDVDGRRPAAVARDFLAARA